MRPIGIFAAICLVGCVDTGAGPQPKRIDPGYVGKHLLAAPPELSPRLDVDLGGKVIYLGNRMSQGRAIPGAAFTITHYWKVVSPPGPGWQVFSMLRGEPTKPDFMNLPATDMQRAHGPATWKAGEIIEDEQEIFLRPDWRSIEATVHIGLIQVGAHNIGDRMNASGPHAKDRAVVARRIEVDLSKAPPPPGTIHVPHAKGAITIDGTANDHGWMGIASSAEWPTAEGSPEPPGRAIGRITWDTDHLYVYANITDPEVYSEFKNHDDPLWKQDCVEIFIDADGNRRGYIELQVNPNNATFDSWFPGGRAAKGDEAWNSNMITAVQLNANVGWEVEIAIPWAAVKGRDDAMAVRLPPQVGDRWRMNVVRVDKKKDGKNPSVSSWNRITYQDWHGLDRMLTVVFADQAGGVAPGTSPIPLPPPGADSATSMPPATSETVRIDIAANGAMRANGTAVTEAELARLLAAASMKDKATGVVVVADPAVPPATTALVADRAKAAGLQDVVVAPSTPPMPASASGSLTIEVAASGSLRANGVAVVEADIGNLFRAAFARNNATQVIIATEPATPQATVIRVVELAKAAGITRLAMSPKTLAPIPRGSAAGSAVPLDQVERSPLAPPSPDLVTPRGGAGSGSATPPTPAAPPAAGSATR